MKQNFTPAVQSVPDSSTPYPLSEPPPSPTFPAVESGGFELGDIASSLAHATLGPFEIYDVLGRGGMGVVFSGAHVHTSVPVAIKVITRRGASHPHFRRSMHNEVRAVASLDHPGIVRVFDYGDIPETAEVLTEGALKAGSPYFVMEMIPHGGLIEVVGRVTWRQGKALLLTLLDALAHSHARDVIHRDIKPGNILLDDWGGRVIPRLADFGLAFALNSPTDASRSIGTPQYMAPEQIETPWREHGPWSDLYSLGCVAYELFTGRKLFQGKSVIEIFRLHLDGTRRPLRSVVRLPEGFQSWLNRMLARDPADRFQTAADAARALLAIDDADVPDTHPPEPTGHVFATVMPVLEALPNSGGADDISAFAWPKRYPTPMRLVGAGLGLFGLREQSLVGRQNELRTLWDSFRMTLDDGPRAVALVGADGVGKTKLATAFAQRLNELGLATTLYVGHSPEKSQEGVSSLLASYFRVMGASRAEAAGVVRERLTGLGCTETYLWEAAAELVAPALAEGDAETGFEFPTKSLRLDAAARILSLEAARAPVVVVIDDAHYGIEALEFVRHVLARDSSSPVLFVVVATEEKLPARAEAAELDALHDTERTRRVDLRALDEVAHLELVQNLLHLTGDVAITVAARTAGNPRFATALIGDWVERGILQVDETGFIPKRDLSRRIPDSLVDVWKTRLDEVLENFPQLRDSLEIAAALGTDVSFDEWVGVCDAAHVKFDLAIVDALIEKRLVIEGRERWSFAHPGVRESLKREAEDAGRWKRWKSACAEYLHACGATRVEVLNRLGQYCLEAERFGEAIEPLMLAARIRERQGDYRAAEEAVAALTLGLENIEDNARMLAEVWVFRARTYIGWGRPDEALRWARKAHDAATANGWSDLQIKAAIFIAAAKQWMGARDGARWIELAFEVLGDISGDFAPDGALVALAYLATSLGRFDEAQRVLDIDEQFCTDGRTRASNRYQRCRLAYYRGRYADVAVYGQEAFDYYESVGHLPALASTVVMLAEGKRKSGELHEAERLYRQSARLSVSLGQSAAVALTSLGEVLLDQGQPAAAEEIFLEGARDAAAANRRRLEMTCVAGLLVCAVRRSQPGAGRHFVPKIEEFFEGTREAAPDLADLLEFAAADLQTAGDVEYSRRAWGLALAQWELLGDEGRVQNARANLARLGEDVP